MTSYGLITANDYIGVSVVCHTSQQKVNSCIKLEKITFRTLFSCQDSRCTVLMNRCFEKFFRQPRVQECFGIWCKHERPSAQPAMGWRIWSRSTAKFANPFEVRFHQNLQTNSWRWAIPCFWDDGRLPKMVWTTAKLVGFWSCLSASQNDEFSGRKNSRGWIFGFSPDAIW